MRISELLRSEFQKLQLKNKMYSLRAFSRDLKVSHSFLCQIMNETKVPSLEKSQEILSKLNISETKKKKILYDIQQDDLIIQKIKDISRKKLIKDTDIKEISALDFVNICHWHFDAIFHLLPKQCSLSEISNISSKLGLTEKRIKECLTKLSKAGLIQIEQHTIRKLCSNYVMDGKHYEMDYDQLVAMFIEYQQELFKKSIHQFKEKKTKDQLTTQMYLIPADLIEVIKSMILRFNDEINIVVSSHNQTKTEKHLYFFNSQFSKV